MTGGIITIAEGIDIPYYALKRLVNHRMSGDVTAGYIVSDVVRHVASACLL